MANNAGANNIMSKIFLPLLWVLGVIIFGISIAGIVKSNYRVSIDLFIVVLVFILLMGLLSVVQLVLQRKSQSIYDVQAGGSDLEKGAKENKGYETVERSNAVAPLKESSGDKWVNNYVPYGDYPNGSDAKKQEMANQNGIHAVDEVDSIENKEVEEKSDSNKQED